MPMKLSASQKAEMDKITAALPTKSAKIRVLSEKGYARADIARFLDSRYQHVRNVLTQPHGGSGTDAAALSASSEASGTREEAAVFVDNSESDSFRVYRFQVDSDGRIKLPDDVLKLLDAAPGGMITARYEDGELRLMNIDASVRFVQSLAAPYIKLGEGNWSDQLVAERRAEAEREQRRDER